MNDKLAHANATADQNWAMNDTTDRRRRAETIVAQRRIARADDVGGCEEATAAGGRGAGSAATLASKLSIDADIVAKMTENQNGFTEKAEVLNRTNYCSAQDVTTSALAVRPLGNCRAPTSNSGRSPHRRRETRRRRRTSRSPLARNRMRPRP